MELVNEDRILKNVKQGFIHRQCNYDQFQKLSTLDPAAECIKHFRIILKRSAAVNRQDFGPDRSFE